MVFNRIIDIHSHYYPESYLNYLRSRNEIPKIMTDGLSEKFVIFPEEEGRLIDESFSNIKYKLDYMDLFDIEKTVLSVGNPWLDPVKPVDSVQLAREINSELAGLHASTAGRITCMGILPSGSPGVAAEVAEEVSTNASLCGLVAGSRICGLTWDAPELSDLWGALNVSRLPVFLHPHYGVGITEFNDFGHALPVGVSFPFETSLALSRFVLSGGLERFPALRIIAAHGGGTLPFLAGRLDAAWRSDERIKSRTPRPPSSYLRMLYADSLVYEAGALLAACNLFGTEHLMFGSDNPFSVSDPSRSISIIHKSLGETAARRVFFGNANLLFGL